MREQPEDDHHGAYSFLIVVLSLALVLYVMANEIAGR